MKRNKQFIIHCNHHIYLQLEGNTSHQHPQNVLGSILSGSGGGNQVSQGKVSDTLFHVYSRTYLIKVQVTC